MELGLNINKKIILPGEEYKVESACNLVVITYSDKTKLKLKDFIQLYKEYKLMFKRNKYINQINELRERLKKFENDN